MGMRLVKPVGNYFGSFLENKHALVIQPAILLTDMYSKELKIHAYISTYPKRFTGVFKIFSKLGSLLECLLLWKMHM